MRRMRWVGSIACMGNKINADSVFMRKPAGKRLPDVSSGG
jgi:hypothetical protein